MKSIVWSCEHHVLPTDIFFEERGSLKEMEMVLVFKFVQGRRCYTSAA